MIRILEYYIFIKSIGFLFILLLTLDKKLNIFKC